MCRNLRAVAGKSKKVAKRVPKSGLKENIDAL
jgi:hypothetical protein